MLQAASQAKWTGLCCRQLMNRSGRCGGWPSMSVQVLPDDTPHDGCAAPCRRQLASWECPVLFSDDAAKFAALQQLNGQQQALQAQRQEVECALQDADKVGRPACGHRCLWVRLRREALLMCSPYVHTCTARELLLMTLPLESQRTRQCNLWTRQSHSVKCLPVHAGGGCCP